MWSLISLVLVSLTAAVPQCPPGYTAFSDAKCFYYSSTPKTVMDAQKNCTSTGGILASISNSFENNYVQRLASEGQKGIYLSWIGLVQMLPDYKFHWVDGTSDQYKNWASQTSNPDDTYVVQDLRSGFWYHAEDAVGYVLPFICSAVPLSTTVTPAPSTSGKCDSSWTWFEKTNHCYKVFYNENWLQAETVCRSAKGHLTSIHSLEENEFVASLAQSGVVQPIERQVWIGLTKIGSNWANVDGTPFDYQAWGPGVPDSGADNCVQIFADQLQGKLGYETTWNAWDCEVTQRAFVCKKDLNS